MELEFGLNTRDGVSTIQMYSSTSMITLNMHGYKYEYPVLRKQMCMSTITLECT